MSLFAGVDVVVQEKIGVRKTGWDITQQGQDAALVGETKDLAGVGRQQTHIEKSLFAVIQVVVQEKFGIRKTGWDVAEQGQGSIFVGHGIQVGAIQAQVAQVELDFNHGIVWFEQAKHIAVEFVAKAQLALVLQLVNVFQQGWEHGGRGGYKGDSQSHYSHQSGNAHDRAGTQSSYGSGSSRSIGAYVSSLFPGWSPLPIGTASAPRRYRVIAIAIVYCVRHASCYWGSSIAAATTVQDKEARHSL